MKQKLLVTLLGLSLLFTACSAPGNTATATPETAAPVSADNMIIAEGRVEPARYAEIAFTTSGAVSKVPVQEGQSVKKGDVLIRLGSELDPQYAAAQTELANAQKALNDLRNSADKDFAQTIIDLKQAKEDYKDAEQYFNYVKYSKVVPQSENFLYTFHNQKEISFRIRTRFWKGPAPQEMITDAENDMALKKATLDKAQRAYDRMKADGIDRDQLAVLEAQLATAEAGVAAFSVTAPFDGIVTDLNAKAGSSISAGTVVVKVADFSHWLVETTDLTEIDVVKLAKDQPVIVKLDALPKVELKGAIVSIGQTYSQNQGDIVYKVTVLLKDIDPAMRWGMTAEVKFAGEG